MEEESRILSQLITRHFGKHVLLIGVPEQADLLKATSIPCHSLLTPLTQREKKSIFIEGDFHELPILTGSIDLVLIPHVLEMVDNPRQLLAEACRIIKPEGLIVVYGFNPYSMWGLKKLMNKNQNMPWSSHFIHASHVKNWLHLADFAMEKQMAALFRPPFNNPSLYQKLHFLENLGSKCLPIFGGVYVLLARAKVIPLTPIRMKWKQRLSSGINITTSIPGNIARLSK